MYHARFHSGGQRGGSLEMYYRYSRNLPTPILQEIAETRNENFYFDIRSLIDCHSPQGSPKLSVIQWLEAGTLQILHQAEQYK